MPSMSVYSIGIPCRPPRSIVHLAADTISVPISFWQPSLVASPISLSSFFLADLICQNYSIHSLPLKQAGNLPPASRWCATQAQQCPWRGQSFWQGQSIFGFAGQGI